MHFNGWLNVYCNFKVKIQLDRNQQFIGFTSVNMITHTISNNTSQNSYDSSTSRSNVHVGDVIQCTRVRVLDTVNASYDLQN